MRRAVTWSLRSGRRCAGSRACPPSWPTSPRSSTASCGWNGWCWSGSGPRARSPTRRTRWPSWPRWPRPPVRMVLDGLIQRRSRPDPSTYIGRGKVDELRDVVLAAGADTVICDGELSPSQLRTPGAADQGQGHRPDRADPRHLRPARQEPGGQGPGRAGPAAVPPAPAARLGRGAVPADAAVRPSGGAGGGRACAAPVRPRSRPTGAGSAPASPGSSARSRAWAPSATPSGPAAARHRVPSVAIAGYTNAGKSSLLNRLTGAGVLVEDALFATLDPTTRRPRTADGRVYTLSDTVGFVRHLPHQLVEAFRSTLEEVAEADLVVHVVDGAHPDPAGAGPRGPRGAGRGRRRRRSRSCWWSTRPTRPRTRPLLRLKRLWPDAVCSSPRRPGRHRRAAATIEERRCPPRHEIARRCARMTVVDLVSTAHPVGEVLDRGIHRRRHQSAGSCRRRARCGPRPLHGVNGLWGSNAVVSNAVALLTLLWASMRFFRQCH